MNVFYSEIAGGILRIVCALTGILFTAVVIPWLKANAIPWMKEKQVYGLVKKFVQAAEKLAETGAIDREEKKEYVVRLLTKKGYNVDTEIEAFIESAVKELDMTIKARVKEIVDTFEIEEELEDVAPIIYDACGQNYIGHCQEVDM